MPKTKQAKALNADKDFNESVKQADLPGMENRAIAELEDAARKYAGIRDRRMALNESEVKLKALLLGLLKKHGKREYKRDGISIWIKVEEETVKVKIEEDDDEKGGEDAIRKHDDARGANREDRVATSSSQGQSERNQSEDSETREEVAAAEERSEEGTEDF